MNDVEPVPPVPFGYFGLKNEERGNRVVNQVRVTMVSALLSPIENGTGMEHINFFRRLLISRPRQLIV